MTKFNIGDRVRGRYEEGSLEALFFDITYGVRPPYLEYTGVVKSLMPVTEEEADDPNYESLYGVVPDEGTAWYGDTLSDDEVEAAREAFRQRGLEVPDEDTLRTALPNYESWIEKVGA